MAYGKRAGARNLTERRERHRFLAIEAKRSNVF